MTSSDKDSLVASKDQASYNMKQEPYKTIKYQSISYLNRTNTTKMARTSIKIATKENPKYSICMYSRRNKIERKTNKEMKGWISRNVGKGDTSKIG